MRIDRTQRGWAVASLSIFAVSALAYGAYAERTPAASRGGSTMGLIFGILGFAFMIFAALLGARKRVPTWRLGRAQTWMRGHLWLGLLSLPLILFHGGFHFGGTLTSVLMWLLIITVTSGLFGAALQNYVPRMMTAEVPLETIYAEIGNVQRLLRKEADRAVESVCGKMELIRNEAEGQRAGGFTALRPISAAAAPLRTSAAISAGASAAVTPAVEAILLSEADGEPLKRFYLEELRPFLERPGRRRLRLGDPEKAKLAFAGLKTLLPAPAHGTLGDLEEICDEARQLQQQERLHRWLHGWLLVHVPLSVALIALGAVHAVMALKY
jgi:hypothetical protein